MCGVSECVPPSLPGIWQGRAGQGRRRLTCTVTVTLNSPARAACAAFAATTAQGSGDVRTHVARSR